MKQRILSVLLAICLLVSMFPTGAWAAEAYNGGTEKLSITDLEGSGTKENPYQVSSKEDLLLLADAVNGNNDLAGLYFEQIQDIDLGGEKTPWPVIGHVFGNTPHPFNGVFDGNDKNISGLFVGKLDEDGDPVGVENEDAGLFGHVGEKGIIRKVHVVDCKVYSKALYVGGIAGRNEGLVEYCSSVASSFSPSGIASGVIDGKWQYAGGIVGYNHGGKISYCYSNCDVYGAQKVGGITGGQNGGTVVNCYFRGYVYASDITRGYAGGIAGENDGDSHIGNCYSDGIIEGSNENAYCGAIAGSNDTGSTVENCFWEDSEETGLPGIASGSGDAENVELRSSEEFESGQVAWELAQGTGGEGWGQNMEGGTTEDGTPYDKDRHPHFVYAPDKEVDTTPVHRVTFKYYADAEEYHYITYVDPSVDVMEPPLPNLEGAKWYEFDENDDDFERDYNDMPLIYDGIGITSDKNAVAGQRIKFTRPDGPVTVDMIYSPEEQKVDLGEFVYYTDDGIPDAADYLEYLIEENDVNLNAIVDAENGWVLVPKDTHVGEYNVTVQATEKAPYIAPLPDGFADEIIEGLKNHEYDDYLSGKPEEPDPEEYVADTADIELKIIIGKATPVIAVRPTAGPIEYGVKLKDVVLDGGKAVHPTTEVETEVEGSFKWTSPGDVVPSVNEAAITGYSVTFFPIDEENYNTNVTFVTMTVNKVDSTVITPPAANDLTYDGTAQYLITEGRATGGVMKYWLAERPDDKPDENTEFSSTVPSRANARTYYVWYKVIGDVNHNDTEPVCIPVTVKPYPLTITEQTFVYNGNNTFTVILGGVKVEGEDSPRSVVSTLTAASDDADEYECSAEAGEGKYTVELSSPNYAVNVEESKKLIIKPLPAILRWSNELIFTYDKKEKFVSAVVDNAIGSDDVEPVLANYTYTDAGNYEASVVDLRGLDRDNYTIVNGQNLLQAWHILKDPKEIELWPPNPIVYGDKIRLTVNLDPTGLTESDKISFYANGQELPGQVQINTDTGEAVLVIENATAALGFSVGPVPVYALYGGNVNEEPAESFAVTIIVNPKPLTAVIRGSAKKMYDGHDTAVGAQIELVDADVETCDRGEVGISAENFIYNSAEVKKANTITAIGVALTGTKSANYSVNDTVSIPGSITAKPVKLEWRGVSDRVYDGNPSNVTATATEFIPGDVVTVEVENGSETNVGKYTATAVSLDNSNYALPEIDITQEYTIAKAPLYLPELIVHYNGTCHFEEEADGVTPSSGETEKVTVKLTTSDPYRGQYVYIPGDSANGEYTYIASTENGNYTIAAGALVIIEMGIPEVTPPVGKKLIYNGKAQELITAGSAVNGKILYSLSEEGPYSEDISVGTEPGTYTIWYKVLGDEGYVDLDPESVTATITKKPVVSSDDRDSSSGSNGNSSGSGVCPRDETCPIWPYTDASTKAWYHDGVHYCIEKGLMEGYGNWIFGPNNTLSRAMLAQIIYNHAGRPKASGNSPFDDVEKGAWYADAVIWAAANGVVEGYGNGRFGPNDPITREQLAAMLYRYEQSQGGGFQGNWMFHMDFNDVADISGWAYEAICWCNMKGIVVGKGDGVLDPRGNATRAEAAAMIMRYFELDK